MVIGKGGETIRALEADYDVQIDIEEDGTILIYATEGDKAEAMKAINDLTKEPEVRTPTSARSSRRRSSAPSSSSRREPTGSSTSPNVGPGGVGPSRT